LSELRVFVDAIRARGARWAALALFRRFVFSRRRMYIGSDPLGAWPPEAGPGDPEITFGLAGPADLEALCVFEPYVLRARLRDWLARDDTWVTVAFDGARPVALRCETLRPPRDPSLPRIELAPHQVWSEENYVLPEYRRRHVSARLRAHAERALKDRGFTERMFKIDAGNYPQLRRRVSRPASRLHHVRSLCVLGIRWRWVDPDGRRALEREVAALERVAGRGGFLEGGE
jgi:GNAT superfamily N-acetyltransferase